MEKTDISDAWQLSLEVLSVELEQVQGVLQSLNGIKQVNIDQNIDIELLITPVNLEQRLEACNEKFCLVVCRFDQLIDVIDFCFINAGFLDPLIRVQRGRLEVLLAEILSYFVIPSLKSLRIEKQISVFTPSLKAFDRLQSLIEGFEDHINELLVVGHKLDPVILNIGSDLAILLDK